MVKAILFDYGGVMNSLPKDGNISTRLAAALGVEKEQAYMLLRDIWIPYSTGKLSSLQVWQHIEQQYGGTIDTNKRLIWNTWRDVKPLANMSDFIKQLNGEGYTTGVVSNSFPETVHEIREHGGYDLFEIKVISCEIGYAKPDSNVYRIALERLPDLSANEVLFVDDQERCIEGAKRCGMKTVLCSSQDQVIPDIRACLAN